ncbi:MAG: ABC transporter permease, partial [Firmicutes bacterium]|nr:ABC transporter permease [Bacillota bacterium]
VKAKMAIINEDGNSAIITAFEASISDIADIIEIDTETKGVQDALFYRKVDYVLIFPKGYSESFFSGIRMNPEKMTLPDSFASVQIENRFSLFVNTASVYYEVYKDSKTGAELETAVLTETTADISQRAVPEIIETWKTRDLYRFKTYCLLGLMTLISLIGNALLIPMLTMKKGKILKRNLCAPVSPKSLNLQILSAVSIIFAATIVFYLSIAAAFFGGVVFTAQGLWICLNTVILGFCFIGLCFLLASVVKSLNALNFAATSLSLVFCFAGGAFIPQSVLSPGFLTFGKMTPAYWYVNNIESAYASSSISGSALTTMLGQMAIVLAFGIVFLVAGFVIQRFKRQKS